jgi:menaquinone-9 beta-reductase
MPVRATKRGADRTPLSGDFDVLVCGASFAGLAVARELRATSARILVLDRYEIGERQTSACAAPTEWLTNLGLEDAILQTFDALVFHTPTISARWPLPWTFSTFDYRLLCRLLWDQRGPETEFETAKVSGRKCNVAGSGAEGVPTGEIVINTDRGDVSAPLVVDALGWRRLLDPAREVTPPEALMSRGLEVHPAGTGEDLEVWIHKGYIEAGYGWSFPAGDEVRVGVGSFEPRHHVKQPTVRLAGDLGLPPDGYQGNWIPHAIRPAAADGVFFVGDSAGQCIPLTAEGIRTALYFGIAAGRELRAVLEGEQSREQALVRYAHFSAERAWKFAWMKRWQDTVWRLRPRARDALVRSMTHRRAAAWAFGHYWRIAPPEFALPAPAAAALPREHADQIAA